MKYSISIAALILLSACSTGTSNEAAPPATPQPPKQPAVISVKRDSSALKKTADMLDEDLYWQVIDESLKKSGSRAEQEIHLINEIGKLTPKQIIGFRLRTDKLMRETYTDKMWCAAYIINGGCSDDGFEYFRSWLISRGKETYYKAKQDPDNLSTVVSAIPGMYEFESFWQVAPEAFERKTGRQLHDYTDEKALKSQTEAYTPPILTWQEGNPASMKKSCPRLFEKAGL